MLALKCQLSNDSQEGHSLLNPKKTNLSNMTLLFMES